MKRGLELARDVETVQLTTTLCVSKMEEHLAYAGHGFTTGNFSGNFATDGYASMRFTASRSDTVLAGGIPDRLMAVTVTVWQDDNGNGVLNSGEISTSFSTKVARMGIYQTATGGA
jgi:hypothetical protein